MISMNSVCASVFVWVVYVGVYVYLSTCLCERDRNCPSLKGKF